MKATKSGMAQYTTQELIDYVIRRDEQYKKAPPFIRRTSMQRWNQDAAAICAEIQKRQMTEHNSKPTISG